MPRAASASRMFGPASTRLQVKAKGHAPELKSITASTATSVIIALPPPHLLSGRFVDTRGKPIAGAYVYMAGWRRSSALGVNLKTDADGRFRWEDAPADPVQIAAGRDGYDGVYRAQFTAGDGEVLLTFRRTLEVSGQPARRRDRRSRQPGRGGGRGTRTPPVRAITWRRQDGVNAWPGSFRAVLTSRQGPNTGYGSRRRDMSRSRLGNSVATRGKLSTTSSSGRPARPASSGRRDRPPAGRDARSPGRRSRSRTRTRAGPTGSPSPSATASSTSSSSRSENRRRMLPAASAWTASPTRRAGTSAWSSFTRTSSPRSTAGVRGQSHHPGQALGPGRGRGASGRQAGGRRQPSLAYRDRLANPDVPFLMATCAAKADEQGRFVLDRVVPAMRVS